MTSDSANYLTTLHEQINKHFNLEDFQMLCFDLHVDYDNLPGETKSALIRELLLAFGRKNRLPELITLLEKERPSVEWPPVPEDFQLPESLAGKVAVPTSYDVDVQSRVVGTAVGDGASVTANNIVGGDMVGGDKVGGDKITVGNVAEGAAVAINGGIAIVHNHPSSDNLVDESITTDEINLQKDYLARFGGREIELAELDAWFTQTETRLGFLMAPAGMGKTALIVNWAKQLQDSDRAIVISRSISLRYGTNNKKQTLQSLLIQMSNADRREANKSSSRTIPSQSLYEHPRDDDPNLNLKLQKNLRQDVKWDKPLVVIVDGLDELADQLNQTEIQRVDFLPNTVGAGIYILAVARGNSDAVREAWQGALGWEKMSVQQFDLGPLKKNAIQKMVCQTIPIQEDDKLIPLADRIYILSENGDPLIASLWMDWLAKQTNTEVPHLLKNLEGRTPGIDEYIKGILAQLEPMVSNAAKPLFELLSLARGPLTPNNLEALGIKIGSIQYDGLINLSGRLIIKDKGAYVFSHSRIRQVVQEKQVSDKDRAKWIGRFHQYGKREFEKGQNVQEKEVSIPTYLLDYYAQHLEKDSPHPDGYEELLYALIDQTWMNAHYKHFGNYDNFLVDVDRALRVSIKNHDIAIQIKGLMCHASITSLSSDLPPHLPALLLRDGEWTVQQAVSHARRVTDTTQRAHTLVTLLTVDKEAEESKQVFNQPENLGLRDEIIRLFLQDIDLLWQQNSVNEAELFQLQLTISPFLSNQHLHKALALASKMQSSIWQVRLLAELLPLMRENQTQQIETTKKIIRACSKINYSAFSDSADNDFIVPTFVVIAKNIMIEQLAVAFAEVLEHESDTNYLMAETNILNYLAWHINSGQALEFVELLCIYDSSLPSIAEKIGRFAHRLDDETAYYIASRLKEEFETTHSDHRAYSSYPGGWAVGVGMAYVMLALSCQEEYQQRILNILSEYMQICSEEDSPYNEQDLRLFCDLAVGKVSDTNAAKLVKEGKFLRRFWHNESTLSRYGEEIVAYLGIEMLKVLFSRCIQSKNGTSYWNISGSPYILPAIAKKLSDGEFPFIYTIGHARGEALGYYGYVRAVIEWIRYREPEEIPLDTIQWTLKGWHGNSELKCAIAPYITPDVVRDSSLRTSIRASMAKYLQKETLQYIIHNFNRSHYGENKGAEVLLQFVRYLSKNERLPILKKMEEETFQIKDSGELNEMINVFENSTRSQTRRRIRKDFRFIRREMKDGYLLETLGKRGPVFRIFPNIYFGSGFLEVVGNLVYAIVRMPANLFNLMRKQKRLLYLSVNTYKDVKNQHQRWFIKQDIWFRDRMEESLFSPPNRYEKKHDEVMRKLVSSKNVWMFYLVGMFTITAIVLLIASTASLLLFPFIALWIIGYILFSLFNESFRWLKRNWLNENTIDERLEHINENRTADIWKSVESQVQALNDLSESKDREDAFVQITRTLGNVIWVIGSRDYRDYAANAEKIWSELKPKFVADALSVLNKHAYVESHDYIRAILPAVVLKDKSLLPDLIRYIEQPYTQLKAIQYACLSYFLTGQERLNYLEKSVAAFSYAEWPSLIIPHILTDIADYATPDLIPHLLRWLSDYPVSSALEKLAPKIVENDVWLAQGFTIAQKIDDPVSGFICGIAPNLNRERVTKAIIFVIDRDLEEEQEKCMPVLVERCMSFPQQEIYEVWQEAFLVMKGYSRPRMLTQLGWFSEIIIRLAGSEHVADVLEEILVVWQWWDVIWTQPEIARSLP